MLTIAKQLMRKYSRSYTTKEITNEFLTDEQYSNLPDYAKIAVNAMSNAIGDIAGLSLVLFNRARLRQRK